MEQETSLKINHIEKLINTGQASKAIALCLNEIKQHPESISLQTALGKSYYFNQQFHHAIQTLEPILQHRPNHIDARFLLFASYKAIKQLDKMLGLAFHFRDKPCSPLETLSAFLCFQDTCFWEEAAKLQPIITKDLQSGSIPYNFRTVAFLNLNTIPNLDPQLMFQIHRRWGKDTETMCKASPLKLMPSTTIHDKIKIAYLSTDFYEHPVGHLALPILLHHDKSKFEVYCYAHVKNTDAMTDEFRSVADHFIDISKLTIPQAASAIAQDGIHILVDLSGHTSNSPLAILAFKPAPVQITYLGYPNTTGLTSVDFRISDIYTESEGGTRYTETVLKMPDTFLCLRGLPEIPRAAQTPAQSNHYITFGSFNHIRKITPQTIQAWAKILLQHKNSKLLIKSSGCQSDSISTNILNEFNNQGITSNRIEIVPFIHSHSDHIALYNDVDIALDTFPYNGTHTTLESLWMGVPVITLAGTLHASRVTASILTCIGFETTITHSIDEYIAKAVDLASRPENLTILRECIHTLLKNSIIFDPQKVTRQIEEQYLKAWELKMGKPAFSESLPELAALTMHDDITILLPRDLNNISTYVLTEQGDWYEDELRFLRCITKPGMRILDCSAGDGCYSLSLAKEVGNTGAVFALEHNARKHHAIEQSAKKNDFAWLSIEPTDQTSDFLKAGVDIMIHPAKGIDANASYLDLSNTISPLIMIHAITESGLDEILTKRLQSQDYNPYRLIPALNLLIPLQEGFTPLSWHRQAFFCKKDKAEALAKDGFLLLHELESIDLPDDLSNWQHAIGSRAYSDTLLPLWVEQIEANQTSADWEQVRNALSAYAMAHKQKTSSQQRYAYLSASLNILLNTEGIQSSTARLCTLARIATELGNHILAQQAIEIVIEGINTCQEFMPHEPFLPISNNYDQDNYQHNLAEWVLAQAVAQAELLKHPTSYFNATAIKETASQLQTLGFPNDIIIQRMKTDNTRKQCSSNKPTTEITQTEEYLTQRINPIECSKMDVPAQPQRRLHIGGKEAHPDWEIMDAIVGRHVDHVGNASDLSRFKENTFDAIYSSHVLEHFGYREEIHQVLGEWYRVLKPNGLIYSSVPNLEVMCELFLNKNELSEQDRFLVMRMIFGGQVDSYDFHKVGHYPELLTHFLTQTGFKNIRIVDSFDLFNDTSNLQFAEHPISLNIIAEK